MNAYPALRLTEEDPDEPSLVANRLYAVPEVRGDYFAVLVKPQGPQLLFAPADAGGGLRFVPGFGPRRVLLCPLPYINPHIRDLAASLFGLKLTLNATDLMVLGRDPSQVLGMRYRGALIHARRMQLSGEGGRHPGRLYPVPELNAYVMYEAAPLRFLFSPMRDDGGLPISGTGGVSLESAPPLPRLVKRRLHELFSLPRVLA